MSTDRKSTDDYSDIALNAVSERVIGCAFRVANTLGDGFLERVYENALAHELHKNGLIALRQHPISVHYDGIVVGDYLADFLVEDQLLLELKAVTALERVHVLQCVNYLRATGLHRCLLLNFGAASLEIKRVVN
jgi:GxxExxY protein